jgi:hypothetical protein
MPRASPFTQADVDKRKTARHVDPSLIKGLTEKTDILKLEQGWFSRARNNNLGSPGSRPC